MLLQELVEAAVAFFRGEHWTRQCFLFQHPQKLRQAMMELNLGRLRVALSSGSD
jgi:hypothetical protein